ncbi:MAG: type II toxin-antitoxin system HicA family toxin [Solirubrobacteraceae bacterium]
MAKLGQTAWSQPGSGHPHATLTPKEQPVARLPVAVRKALLDAGWSVARQSGSHEVWAHPDREDRIVVAGKARDTVPIGTLGGIRRASGLEQLR